MRIAGTIDSALTTFAGLGTASILEQAGARRVRLGWTVESEPSLVVSAEGMDDDSLAACVHDHAVRASNADSWIGVNLEDPPWNGRNSAFSPRIRKPTDERAWRHLASRRSEGIDRLTLRPDGWLDLEFIGALGEPAYWRSRQKELVPDQGASRWEMKTRNRGEEFVGHRLRSLAEIVANRTVEEVREGLTGAAVVDEAYRGKRSEDSRTSTGLTEPQFTDSALAWCGLWGITAFPLVHRISGPSVTAGAFRHDRSTGEELIVPAFTRPVSLHRWLSVIASAHLLSVVETGDFASDQWLQRHGVDGVLRYPVNVTDAKVPERSIRMRVIPDTEH